MGTPERKSSERLAAVLRLRLLRCAALLALAAVWLGAQPAPAAARSLRIRQFSSEIFVQPDASLAVTETIQAQFIGSWNGIYRTIPVQYATPQGFNYTLFVTLEEATTEDGRRLRVETSRQGHNLEWKIYVPGASDATRTIVLHYRVRNGLRFFRDHDELYWNVTGNQWDVPIESASAQILLPPHVTGIRAVDYTGAYGSRARDADVTVSDNSVNVEMQRPLGFHEGLTVVVGWDKGFVTQPGTWAQVEMFLESNWPLFLIIPVFLFMFWLWYTRGRDPRTGPIAVQYAPPDSMTPAEAGTLIDESADMRDITATIVDLAVRGYLVIEEKDTKHALGLLSSKEYVFHMKKKPSEWSGLKSHELILLAGIFFDGAVPDVPLSSLHNRFYTHLPKIRDGVFEALLQHGYFQHRPDSVRGAYIAGGIITAALLFVGGNSLANRLGMVGTPFLIAAVASAGIIIGFGWYMPTRTMVGVKALAGLLGFEDFLTHVEADRLQRMSQTPDTFEKFLPFAMALGVERKWVTAFQNIYTQPPSWYQGGAFATGFEPLLFVNSLNAMTASTGAILASAPRSSGGSGFGGGGGAGGGFGGGGGGGF